MAGIVVVGSMNMDVVTRVKQHPRPGETVHGEQTTYEPGGKGANQAVAAARAGADVRMFGALGDDGFGRTLLTSLQQDSIDLAHVRCLSGSSGSAFITVDAQGENTIIVASGANGLLTKAMLAEAIQSGLFADVSMLLVQNEIPASVSMYAMQAAQAAGVRVVFNPAPVAGVSLDWLAHVDTMVVNETEAEALTGVAPCTDGEIREAAARLLATGVQEVVITLGAKGSVYAARHDAKEQAESEIMLLFEPAVPVAAIDTTAAGDTFVGAFAAARCAEMDTQAALRFASAAAALTVTREGAQNAIPRRADIVSLQKRRQG